MPFELEFLMWQNITFEVIFLFQVKGSSKTGDLIFTNTLYAQVISIRLKISLYQ
jgi:hypothetical protein